MLKRLKAFFARKAKGAVRSSTMGVAGLTIVAGGWIAAHPDLISTLAPKYQGVILAVVGLLTAIARLRTAGKE